MRRAKQGGLCSVCGIEASGGLYWESVAKVLDFGVSTMPPIEPAMEPTRCDRCELITRVRLDFEEYPAEAPYLYAAETANDFLRREGVIL